MSGWCAVVYKQIANSLMNDILLSVLKGKEEALESVDTN